MPIRILIVDDDKPTRDLIRDYLARDSNLLVVAEATDGKEGVALAEQYRPDLVLMDLALKGMSGLKATKLIKKSCPDTEVVILTGYEFEDLKDRARESPEMVQSSAFLSKRQIRTQLLPVINSLMKKKVAPAKSADEKSRRPPR